MAARDDHRVGRRRQRRAISQSAIGSTMISSASGKRSRLANFSRSSTTWVRKPAMWASSRDVPADVAGADDVEMRGRRERVDVDVHLAAADEAVLLGEVVVEVVVEQRAAAGGDRFARFPEGVVLVAPAADRADRAAVGEDEHLRARPLRRRAVGADDGHERGRLAARERVGGGRQDLFVQTRTSILDFCFSEAMNSSAFACFFWPVRNCLTCSLTCVERHRGGVLVVGHLDDVVAELGGHDVADLARLEREGGLVERRDHLARGRRVRDRRPARRCRRPSSPSRAWRSPRPPWRA